MKFHNFMKNEQNGPKLDFMRQKVPHCGLLLGVQIKIPPPYF